MHACVHGRLAERAYVPVVLGVCVCAGLLRLPGAEPDQRGPLQAGQYNSCALERSLGLGRPCSLRGLLFGESGLILLLLLPYSL